jgi:GMP synthase (glutamine-hydrolysing)
MQTIVRLPEGAVKLARSDKDECHAFRWGRSTWGVQFHPEFSIAMMRGYITARHEKLLHEGIHPPTIHGTVTAAPLARKVLKRFIDVARRQA